MGGGGPRAPRGGAGAGAGGGSSGDAPIPPVQLAEWEAELRYLGAQGYFCERAKAQYPDWAARPRTGQDEASRFAAYLYDMVEDSASSVLEAPVLFAAAQALELPTATIKILGEWGGGGAGAAGAAAPL